MNVTVVVNYNKDFGVTNVQLADIVLFGGDSKDYTEWSLTGGETPILRATVLDDGKGKLTITFVLPAAEIAKLPEAENKGIDVYVTFTAGGVDIEKLISFYIFDAE